MPWEPKNITCIHKHIHNTLSTHLAIIADFYSALATYKIRISCTKNIHTTSIILIKNLGLACGNMELPMQILHHNLL